MVKDLEVKRILPPGHSIPTGPMSGVKLGGQSQPIGIRPKANFRLCGLSMQPILQSGQAHAQQVGVPATEICLSDVKTHMSCKTVHMPFGLLTETEKQVPLGRLQIRPIQWHLKNHWGLPQALKRKFQSLDLCTLIFSGGPRKQTFFQVNLCTPLFNFSMPFLSLHEGHACKFSGIKGCIAGPERFQYLVQGLIVLIAADNTTVVAYINKEVSLRSGRLY